MGSATATQVKHGYALWLGYLNLAGSLDALCLPCDRASRESLLGYIKALQSRLAPVSVCTRLRDLSEARRVMQPNGNRDLVVRALRTLERSAMPSRDLRARLAAPSEIYEAGIRLMDCIALRTGPDLDTNGSSLFRWLAHRHADRQARPAPKPRRNDDWSQPCQGWIPYRWRFGPAETKTGETIDADLPAG